MSANQNQIVGDDDPRMAWPQGSALTSDDIVDFSDFTWPGRDDDNLVTSHRDLNLLLQPLTHFEVNTNNFEDSLLAPNTSVNLHNDVNGFDFASERAFVGQDYHLSSEDPEELALRALQATDFSDLHAPTGTHNLGAEMAAGVSVGGVVGNGAGPAGYVGGRWSGIRLGDGYAMDHGPGRIGAYDPVLLAGNTYPPLDCAVAETSHPITSTNYGLEPFRFVPGDPLCVPFVGIDVHGHGHLPEHVGTGAGLRSTIHDCGGSFGAGSEENPAAEDLPDEWFATTTDVGLGITHGYDNAAPGGADGGVSDVNKNGLQTGATENTFFDSNDALDTQGHDGGGTQDGAGVPDEFDFTWVGPVSVGEPLSTLYTRPGGTGSYRFVDSVEDIPAVSEGNDSTAAVGVGGPLSILYTRPGGTGSYRFVDSVDDVPAIPEGNDSTAAAGVGDANNPAVRPHTTRPRSRMPLKAVNQAGNEGANKVPPARQGTKRKAPDDESDDVNGLDTSRFPQTRFPQTRSPSGTSFLLASKNKVDITAALNDPAVPKDFERKLPTVADEPDPWTCHLCYHTFIRQSRLRDHYLEKHPELRLTRKTAKDYPFAKAENCHRLSWYIARGDDTTYTGTDRKQFNARRRMAAGIKTDSPQYLLDVYKHASKLR